MPRYEYKLVPAPERATKIKGLKGAASFAATLEALMNELGADGWHYLRADTLPQEERSGLTSRTTTYRNILVFQRALADVPADTRPAHSPRELPAPQKPRPVAAQTAPLDAADDTDDEPSLANLFADRDDDSDDTVKP